MTDNDRIAGLLALAGASIALRRGLRGKTPEDCAAYLLSLIEEAHETPELRGGDLDKALRHLFELYLVAQDARCPARDYDDHQRLRLDAGMQVIRLITRQETSAASPWWLASEIPNSLAYLCDEVVMTCVRGENDDTAKVRIQQFAGFIQTIRDNEYVQALRAAFNRMCGSPMISIDRIANCAAWIWEKKPREPADRLLIQSAVGMVMRRLIDPGEKVQDVEAVVNMMRFLVPFRALSYGTREAVFRSLTLAVPLDKAAISLVEHLRHHPSTEYEWDFELNFHQFRVELFFDKAESRDQVDDIVSALHRTILTWVNEHKVAVDVVIEIAGGGDKEEFELLSHPETP